MRNRLIPLARILRSRRTEAEALLWSRIRQRQIEGVKFRRQVPLGPYIPDFVSFERKIVIELDGGGHLEKSAADQVRDEYLRRNGFAVLRFWNHEVFTHLDAVLEMVACRCRGTPPPQPSPVKGEGA